MNKQFRILSLDGGGIRGAFTASLLAELEKYLGRPIGEYFDLIAGTSTGAIIAAGLAMRIPAETIKGFYKNHGPKIFTRRPRTEIPKRRFMKKFCLNKIDGALKQWNLDYDLLFQSKYEAKELRSSLEEVFKDELLGKAKTRLVIPSVDLIRGQTVVFKTAHLPGLFRDKTLPIVNILMSTTAAPMYFPHAVIGEGSAYADGGLWANNPSMVAVAEALRISEDCNRKEDCHFTLSDIHLLGIGTGKQNYPVAPNEDAGLAWWAPHLINLVPLSQSQGIDFQAKHILRDRYRRVDFNAPDAGLGLDDISAIPALLHHGSEQAKECFHTLKEKFFAGPAPAFHPFELPQLSL